MDQSPIRQTTSACDTLSRRLQFKSMEVPHETCSTGRSHTRHGCFVALSQVTRARLKHLHLQANQAGQGADFVTAFRRVIERLQREPWLFGEPSHRLPALKLEIRKAAIAPLVVDFGCMRKSRLCSFVVSNRFCCLIDKFWHSHCCLETSASTTCSCQAPWAGSSPSVPHCSSAARIEGCRNQRDGPGTCRKSATSCMS